MAASIPVPRAAPGGKKSYTLSPGVYCEAVKMPDGSDLGPIGILLFASIIDHDHGLYIMIA